MIHAAIPCSKIYSTEYDHGTLYALILRRKMSHKTLSAKLDEVDKSLRATGNPELTRFRSISLDPFNGKIKTFQRGEQPGDPCFNVIIDINAPGGYIKMVPHSHIKVCIPEDAVKLVDDGAPVDYEEDPEDEVEMQPDGTDAVFEENEDIQSPDPKPSGKKRAASSDGLDLKKMCIDDGGPCSVAGGMQEEKIQRLREGLEVRTAENEELKRELVAAKEKAVSVFFPLFAPDSIDPSFDRRRMSVC